MGLIRFTTKSLIAGGLVYYTVQEGMWGSPEESGRFYNKLYNNISPLIQKNIPQDVIQDIPQIPNLSDFKRCTEAHYNKYLIASIKFLSELPIHVSNGIEKIQKEIEKANLSSGEPAKLTESK